MSRILIIDDDTQLLMLLRHYLSKKGFEPITATNAANALTKLSGEVDAVLCDYRLPDSEGFELLKAIRSRLPGVPVIIITGYSDIRLAVEALRLGAYDYVVKPVIPEEILLTLRSAISTDTARPQLAPAAPTTNEFVQGASRAAEEVERFSKLVANTNYTVLLHGESGTGKEVAAKNIHQASQRANGPFVALDCGALPLELAGSELFGHVRGAFTGALQNRAGVFEQADGGTLFLDEVGNLSYENQVQLLRVLQERTVRRLGAQTEVTVNLRVIAASNENLKKAAAEGRFREDLFFRLNEFTINLPALRHRTEDIPALVAHFLQATAAELGRTAPEFSPEALQMLLDYQWPGNIRELRNVVKRATLLADGNTVGVNCLPPELALPVPEQATDAVAATNLVTDLKTAVANAERATILAVLAHCKDNKTQAAQILGIDRKTLYNKMHAYKLQQPQE